MSEEEISRDNILAQGPAATSQHFPWFGNEFLQLHESSHIIYDFGLTPDQRSTVDQLYAARKADPDARWLSPASYTAANQEEYFANSAAAYFGASHSLGGDPDYSPDWLRTHDPKLYELLRAVFPPTAGSQSPTDEAAAPAVPVAAGAPTPAWDTVLPADIPPELRSPPPPPPPAAPRPSRFLRWPGCLMPLVAVLGVLLIAIVAVLAVTGGGDDDRGGSERTGSVRSGGSGADADPDTDADADADAAAAECALHTVLTLLGIDKVPGQYHQGNIAVDVLDAANAPVDGAEVSIRTEKSDGTSTTASGTTAQGRTVFGMRTTRFGSNALVVTGVTKPGCSWTPSATETLRWDAVP